MITIAVVRNILVRVGADIHGYQNNMAQAQRSMGGFQAVMRTATSNTQLSMQSIATSLTMGRLGFIALGAAAVASFALVSKNAIKAAMDVVESESLFTVSMGSMANAARAWSEDLQASLGLNAYEVRRNVGVFYNMTTSMGLARSAAYKLSTDLTKLAYDMSSFYNMPVEEMFIKLQSGITGETEPLKRIGILVLDNVIKQYAYAEGIANVGAELTEQQKVMARYIAIMAQTKNANGDLARTITSPSNQLRLLRMQLDLARINLGNAFMPIVTIVLPVLTSFAKSLVRVTNTFAQFMGALFGTNTAQTQTSQSAADAAEAQTKLGNAAKKAGAAAKKGVAGFDEIHQLQEDMASTAEDAADAMDASSTTPTPSKQDDGKSSIIPKGILDAAERAKKALKVLKPLSGSLSDLGESLGNLGRSISENPIIQQAFKFLKEDIQNLGTGGIYALSGALRVVAGAVNIVAGALSGNFETSLKGAEQAVSGTFDIVTGIMYPVFPEIAKKMQEFKKDFGQKWASLKEDVKTYGDPTKLEAMDFAMYIRDKVSEKWGELKVNTATKWGEIKTSISEKWELIKSIKWDDVKNTVSKHWETLKTNTATKWDELKATMSDKWEKIKIGIGWDGVKNTVLSHWESLGNETGPKWDDLKTTLSEKWEGIKTGISWEDIKDNVINIWEDLKIKTGTIWDEIGKSIKKSVNFVIDTINSFIDGINAIKIEIPAVVVMGKKLSDGASIGFPQIKHIPKLARGGIIDSPTLAMMGEGNKEEAVVPLENTSFVDTLAGAIGTVVLSALQFSQPQQGNQSQVQAVFNLDGSQFARAIIPLIDNEKARIGKIAVS